ncbi:hypothetical protein CHS0354_016226 [Potamilus streckersoni]|uniref:G-protein coupled receptors family 1 profile domain-containing protein n=1 Tax=Potamilus streckersoni TaxID=2493646 RepID=A0AAE0RXI4_9BIVA|nr:hypothetical protein CHS0354_016226 [Potamilus streckersoni]
MDEGLLAVIGILTFCSVLGIFGNALVLCVYVRKRNKVASTVFIITLAATDFMTCLIIIPYTIAVEYLRYEVKYDIFCKLYMFFITSNVPFSAFIMVGIAFDRYLCICHPFKQLLNAKRAKGIIAVMGVFAVTLGILTALNFGVYQLTIPTIESIFNDNINFKYLMSNFTETSSNLENLYNDSVWIAYNSTQFDRILKTIHAQTEYLQYTGICKTNEIIFDSAFTYRYQKAYSSFYVMALIIVSMLYTLVLRSVLARRTRRLKMNLQKSYGCVSSNNKGSTMAMTQVSVNGHEVRSVIVHTRQKCLHLNRQMTIREKCLIANIKTALMLFVVTAVFTVFFLPAWLMAHSVIPYNIVIFYMYFFYNVANPIIYAFMNAAFRRDLKDISCCK